MSIMRKKMLPQLIATGFVALGISQMQAQVILADKYENENAPKIGTFENINFTEGGFSSLLYIPNTNGTEFWTVTDRGVNIDAENANANALPSAKHPSCKPTYDKLYAFPGYAPKIMRLKIKGDKIEIVKIITIKRPDRKDATGNLNPTGLGSKADEVASTNVVSNCADFDKYLAPKDIWGIDSEGLDVDKQGNFWICEEGGPTIWKVSPKGILLKRYRPYAQNPQPQDVVIDACFSFRRNNRGFEGISVTPNGKVYAIIQSPLYYKNNSGVAGSGSLSTSQIHRILEIDPTTDQTKMYAYANDGAIGSLKPKDFKIGDLRDINNSSFLVIEQGTGKTDDSKKMYVIDISNATPVKSGLAYGGKTLEELNTPSELMAHGINPVSKTLLFDLNEKGWPRTLEKAEGIAIIDKNTIAVCNDNDFGQTSEKQDGIATATGIKSGIYIFKLGEAESLKGYILSGK